MKRLLLVVLALAWMAGCSSQTSQPAATEKPQPKPTEFMTGRSAFQKAYIAARGWARDAQPFRLQSLPASDSKGLDGKADLWRASFGSAAQRSAKPYVWSGTDAPDAPSRGVNPGVEDSYNPSNSSTQVFDAAFLKVDSDKAFETAQQHGGDKLLQKTPDTPVLYMLDWNRGENALVWHVIYGTSRDDAKLVVDLNASSGEFMRVEK